MGRRARGRLSGRVKVVIVVGGSIAAWIIVGLIVWGVWDVAIAGLVTAGAAGR